MKNSIHSLSAVGWRMLADRACDKECCDRGGGCRAVVVEEGVE